MTFANTRQTYGGAAKFFHWTIAALIFVAIPLGVVANRLPIDTGAQIALKGQLFSLHKTVGVTVFFVALARILWALTQPKPAPLHPERRLQTFAAEAAHWMLYGSLVLVPLTGWIHHAATTGFAPILWPFGQDLPLVPKDEGISELFSSLHVVIEKVLLFALIAHVAGALKHVFIDRDVTLARMLPGRAEVPPLPDHPPSYLPVAAAVGAFALAAGIAVARVPTPAETPTVAPLSTAQSTATAAQSAPNSWTVQSGSLSIAVQQFGSTVEGAFADWTAAITFDPDPALDVHGDVQVVISIPSLTLGSVTDQALGADFFDATTYQTATFSAQIQKGADGYNAEGTLTIKDKSVPLTLPFALALTDDTAEMTARTQLDRRTFGIGDTMTSDSELGFAVDVVINLTAERLK